MPTYDEARAIFDQEYARTNGFGRAGITLDRWTTEEVQKFIRGCDQAATSRGASLKGVLVGANVARKLGIDDTIGQGGPFEGIPCFVTVTEDDDRVDLIFGPTT
jgi:hypothetical protein